MICFEVYRNGEKLCTAGVGDIGVMHAIIGFVGRRPEVVEKLKSQGVPDPDAVELYLSAGGLQHSRGVREYVDWSRCNLQTGDEIRVRVVECVQPDEPSERRHDDPGDIIEDKKKYVLEMAEELGWKVDTESSPRQRQ